MPTVVSSKTSTSSATAAADGIVKDTSSGASDDDSSVISVSSSESSSEDESPRPKKKRKVVKKSNTRTTKSTNGTVAASSKNNKRNNNNKSNKRKRREAGSTATTTAAAATSTKSSKTKKKGIKTMMIYFDPTTGERKVPNDNRPKNDDERKDERHKGTLYGYMKAPKGRPTKQKGTPKPSSNETSTEATVPPPQSSVSATSTSTSTKPKINRGPYTKGGATYETAMAVGIASLLLNGGEMAIAKTAIEEKFPGMCWGTIKRPTLLSRYKKKLNKLKKEEDHEIDDDLDMFDRRNAKNEVSLGLTNESDIKLIESIAQARDDNNCGMSRKEAITLG